MLVNGISVGGNMAMDSVNFHGFVSSVMSFSHERAVGNRRPGDPIPKVDHTQHGGRPRHRTTLYCSHVVA